MSSALVLCNGEPPSRALARWCARTADRIVAADGGANSARSVGITPHVIIGDLDSMTRATRHHFRNVVTLHVARQDNTDLEKALDFLASHHVQEVTILGATGKRIDFTLGNFVALWNYSAFMEIRLAGDGWFAMPVGRKKVVAAPTGTTVSLIPFGSCDGVSLRGLEFPLTNVSMRVGETGVSNVVRRSPFSVRVRRGAMLLVVLRDLMGRTGRRR
jgi:thiamine pyrophosphokinase